MKYLLLIYGDEASWDALSPAELAATSERYMQLGEAMGQAGVMEGGAQLKPSTTATVVRDRDGETLVADGPFVETKEQLGGYYLVDCETLDDAIAWAARIPAASYGAIEVRPLVE